MTETGRTPEEDELLSKLFRQYYNKLLIIAYAYLRDRDRAEEIVQDTFHEATMKICKLEKHTDPKLWLMKTCENKARNSVRIRARYLRRVISLDALDADLPDNSKSVEDIVVDQVSNEKSAEALIASALSKEELYLLKRVTLDNVPHLKVAKELKISVWTSQKRLERIRDKLRKIFPHRKGKK